MAGALDRTRPGGDAMIKQILKFLPFLIAARADPAAAARRAAGLVLSHFAHPLAASYAIAALGLTVLLGYSGQISLAQAAFFGIGAYMFSILAVRYSQPYWLAALAALAVAAAFGFILGAISLRLASHYLALVTIGFQIITQLVLNNWHGFTGGADGISNIPRPACWVWIFPAIENFYWFSIGVFALARLCRLPAAPFPAGRRAAGAAGG